MCFVPVLLAKELNLSEDGLALRAELVWVECVAAGVSMLGRLAHEDGLGWLVEGGLNCIGIRSR